MQVEVLGRPAISIDGHRVELRGRQPALLAALTLHAPRAVSSETLLSAVWGTRLPRDPGNALQQRISELRRIADPTRTGAVVRTIAGGYALTVEDEHIDARRFARLAAEGRSLLVAGDVEVARTRLEQALALWHGPAFDGIADDPWLTPEIERLHELRLTAREDHLEALLALGGGPELVAELASLHAAEPLRERLAGQLMRAHYRAGQQADALAVFERTRDRLADELGVDPGPALSRVHLQVLRQADDLEVATLATPRRAPRTTNLPAPTRSVIGRDTAIREVRGLLEDARLVTLTGTGGAGKTTLALAAAREHARPVDGTWLVELAGLRDGPAIVAAIAREVGIGGTSLPRDADTLAARLHAHALLLILDTCEHVIAEAAALVDALLAGAPEVRVLATSREPLGVDGEVVAPVAPLAVPDADATSLAAVLATPAVQLLVERLSAADPGFALQPAHAPAAVSIVRRLDGIPLAIELAAGRGRSLALPELAAALDDRFVLLTATRRSSPTRQRTLRAAIDWSWDLLDEDLQAAWAALSVPVAGVDRTRAATLLDAAGVTRPCLDVLHELVERSVLRVDTTTAPSTYRMLESMRAYGHERLCALGHDSAVRIRHADAVAAALAACQNHADPSVFGVDLEELSRWIDEATAVLTWALEAGELRRVQRLAAALGWVWLLRGQATTGIRWLEQGLGADEGAPPEDLDPTTCEPAALVWLSCLLATGGSPHGRSWAALSLQAELDPVQRVLAELFAGVHEALAGEPEEARIALHGAIERAGRVGGWLVGFAHLVAAQVARLSGHLDVVRRHVELALEPLTDVGADWARVQAIDVLLDTLDPQAEPGRCRRLATEGLAVCRRHDFPELEGRMLLQLGVATHAAGDHDLAARELDEALALIARAERGPSLGFALLVTGAHARQRGELDLALEQLSTAKRRFADASLPYGSTRVALELGRTHLARGELLAASSRATEAARLVHQLDDPELSQQIAELQDAVEIAAAAPGDTEGAPGPRRPPAPPR